MQPLIYSVPTLALSVIYCLYRSCSPARRGDRILRERVAYLLWEMARERGRRAPREPPGDSSRRGSPSGGTTEDDVRKDL
jgi:hypothetical protein